MERGDLPIISLSSDPAKPAPKPVVPPAPAVRDDDEAERLIREYTERQKSKVARLEQELAEAKKTVAERDALRAKNAALQSELAAARKKLEESGTHEATIKDLQAKVDAALLSHSMIGAENAKLKMRIQESENVRNRHEERAFKAEERAGEAERLLLPKAEALREAEERIAAAAHALQSKQNGKLSAPTSPILRR